MALIKIQQGDIWLVNFNPQIGNEIAKTRPAVVISNSLIHARGLAFVVPITSWQNKFQNNLFFIELLADNINNLKNDSFVNCTQVKSFSFARFINPIGKVDNQMINLIKRAFLIGL